MTDLKTQALELAKSGVAIFPLDEDKKPRTTHGFHDATTDVEQVGRWNWNGGGNIGAAIPDGHFVVDVDPRNGGDNTLEVLAKLGKPFPATKVHSTRSGGTHRFYKLPEDLHGRSLRGSLGPGVDIKAAGRGYVVYPPSPGYAVKWNTPVAEAPQWMLDEIVKPEVDVSAGESSPPKFFEVLGEKGTGYGLAAMDQEIAALADAPEGSRNSTLNKAAFSLSQLVAGGELQEKEARLRLEDTAEKIGLDPGEIQQTIKSGWSAGLEEPRQAPVKEPEVSSFEHFSMADAADEHYWTNWQVEEPPPPFYLHPIVPKHAYIIVYGATESSKSMAFKALGSQASHKGIKVTVHSLENPAHVDRHRLRRLDPDPKHFRLSNQIIDLNDPRQLEDLVEKNKPGGVGSWDDGMGTDWLIIDTYSHSFNSRSEDGNSKAIDFARRMRYVMHKVGCTVILIDHTGYEQREEPRDASAKRQQVDVGIYMEKIGKWAPGQPSVFSMSCTKSARFGNPFFYRAEIADVANGLEMRWRLGAGDQEPRWEG